MNNNSVDNSDSNSNNKIKIDSVPLRKFKNLFKFDKSHDRLDESSISNSDEDNSDDLKKNSSDTKSKYESRKTSEDSTKQLMKYTKVRWLDEEVFPDLNQNDEEYDEFDEDGEKIVIDNVKMNNFYFINRQVSSTSGIIKILNEQDNADLNAKDKTKILLESYEDDQSDDDEKDETENKEQEIAQTWLRSFFTLRNLIVVVLISIVLITVIVLVSVLSTKKQESFNSELNRLDCLPWTKEMSLKQIEKECLLNSNCIFEPVKGEKAIPACFYDKRKNKLKLIYKEETDLGVVYTVQHESGLYLKIEFQFLDSFALRFKIYNPFKKEYEVPIKINKPEKQARNKKYEIQTSDDPNNFYFKIVRKSTGTVM
jgi:hypothetical protein